MDSDEPVKPPPTPPTGPGPRNQGPLPPLPPGPRRVAAKDWLELIASRVPPPVVRVPGPEHTRVEGGGLTFAIHNGFVRTKGLSLNLSAGQSWAAGERIATAVLDAAIALHHATEPAASPRSLAGALAKTDLERIKPATWSGGGRRLTLDGPDLVVSWAAEGWVSSHERGLVEVEIGRVPLLSVPAASLDALVKSLAIIATAINDRPLMICRFCRQAFSSSHYLDDLGACHGCAQTHLGIVF